MATVRLSVEQCRADDLPPVCVRCGRPATDRVERKFTWHPPWAAALLLLAVVPGLVAMILTTRRRTVRLPVCDRHKRHWANLTAFAVAAGLVFGAVLVAGVILLDNQQALGRVVMNALVWLAVGCVGVAGVWTARLIRPERIDADGLVLTGVAEAFAADAKALRDEAADRGYGEFDDEDERPRRRRNRYEGDD